MNTLEYILDKYRVKRAKVIRIYNSREMSLVRLFKTFQFTVGAEIGVGRGAYSKMLCLGNPQLKLYGIDSWQIYDDYGKSSSISQKRLSRDYEAAKNRLKGFNVQLIQAYSMDAVKDFADESLDFVYIDANHKYEYCKEDIREWSKKVKRGGLVAGHDYVDGLHGDIGGAQTNFGVKKAVDEWISVNNIEPLFIFEKGSSPTWFYVKP